MALNPPLTNEGFPIRLDGEYFLLEREDIEFDSYIDNGGRRCGKGKVKFTFILIYSTKI